MAWSSSAATTVSGEGSVAPLVVLTFALEGGGLSLLQPTTERKGSAIQRAIRLKRPGFIGGGVLPRARGARKYSAQKHGVRELYARDGSNISFRSGRRRSSPSTSRFLARTTTY